MRAIRFHQLGIFLVFLAISACRSTRPASSASPGTLPVAVSGGIAAQGQDPSTIYNQMGLIATGSPLSYVGKIAYFATRSPDTTMMLASISIPNRMLSFIRDGDAYRAPYEVRLRLLQGNAEVKAINAMEIVRVATFKEVNRNDESVIFQNYFRVPPGDYHVSFTVRDVASNRSASQEGAINVPRLTQGNLSTPLLVYEASRRSTLDSLPRLLASPRSSAVFGQDSTVSVYLEAYGAQPSLPVSFVVQNDKGAVTWRDTTVLTGSGNLMSGAVSIPISRVGIGVANVTFTRLDAADTVRAPVFVSFGSDIPLLTYEELMNQLRYYVSPERLRSLRDTPIDERGPVWAAFLRASDPAPSTPEHEGLQTYFARLQQAAVRFRDDGTSRGGWLSDRARVYVVLGEPDQLFEQQTNSVATRTSIAQRGRLQYWEYSQYRVRLVFYDETGTGRWRLTPQSETDFQNINARLLIH
ncbi:MAG TPA: GWxTD domain-containing protein [Gemmatimonadaceae bacterium]